jgi:hypothetical protein
LNLAHNSLEHVPKLSSRSLEILNFSSNHIHYLSEYFASNLHGIRYIDFDYNYHLNQTSPRAFCFLNIVSLEQMTFRSNNLLSLNTFSEFLCRLVNHTDKMHLIDINNNINLKCNCSLIRFKNYLNNYHDLTCTRQGQDRYYISKLAHWFSNCTHDLCSKRFRQTKIDYCNWLDAERAVYDGTCQAKLLIIEQKKEKKAELTSTTTATTVPVSLSSVITTDYVNLTLIDNSTLLALEKQSKSRSIAMNTDWFVLLLMLSRCLFS